MNLEIGDKFTFITKGYNETHLVTGFQKYENGEMGVETRRFIKSRNDWAKNPQAWTTIESMEKWPEAYKLVS